MRRTQIKFCGITDPTDAADAVRAGADAIGVILWAARSRRVTPELAQTIYDAVPAGVRRVGVFVDADPNLIREMTRNFGLHTVQLHGHETSEDAAALGPISIVKAIRPAELSEWMKRPPPNLAGLLIDSAAGGSGAENDWDAAAAALAERPPTVPIWLAGGLTPQNVGAVVARFRPAGVDVSSGIESGRGRKALERMVAFTRAVCSVDTAERTGDDVLS